MSGVDNNFSAGSFPAACDLVCQYLGNPAKASDILTLVEGKEIEQSSRRWLFLGILRHWRFLQEGLGKFLSQKPRVKVEAILLTGAYEIWATRTEEGRAPRVVNSAVGLARTRCSAGESALVNAVLRRWAARVGEDRAAMEKEARQLLLPDWLRQRWLESQGTEWVEAQCDFLENVPEIYVNLHAESAQDTLGLEATAWAGFFRVGKNMRRLLPLLEAGRATIQDPSTRLAVDVLLQGCREPDHVLDLCASPGGKTRAILAATPDKTRVTAVDRPDKMERLRENLAPWHHRVELVACDLLSGQVPWEGSTFGAVLLDAPCSNTGVIGRRPDAKWRIRPADLVEMPRQQSMLLARAAGWVSPGGCLVYSTCSMEPEENLGVVESFLASPWGQAFTCSLAGQATPPTTGHDGAGFCLLQREH